MIKTIRMKTLLLLLSVCTAAWLLAGCVTSRTEVQWDSYDETTTTLHLYDSGLTDKDIAPLENLTGLVSLTITAGQISDLTPLENLTALTSLNLSSNRISDLTPLANLTNLEKLYLYNNQISDLTPLANLTNLTVLFVDDNKVTDLAPLANLKNLTMLGVLNNNITDWSYVAHVADVEGNPANAVLLTETTASINVGQFFYVALNENQSVPMRWVSAVSDESVARLVCTEVDSSQLTSNMPGSPGEKRIFYFLALSPGECTIDLYDMPISDVYDLEGVSPSRSYTFTVM